LVSLPRMPDIMRLRVSLSTTSVTHFSAFQKLPLRGRATAGSAACRHQVVATW
jgi:hypothetical protein